MTRRMWLETLAMAAVFAIAGTRAAQRVIGRWSGLTRVELDQARRFP